jgi:hypothetical protein
MERAISSIMKEGVVARSNCNTLTSWMIKVLIANLNASLKSFLSNGIKSIYQKYGFFAIK